MKNKNLIILLALFGFVLCSGVVSAVDLSVENYYPTPVEAGDYFTIWLKIANREENPVEGVAVRFKQSYPFSLDPGEEEELAIGALEPKSSVTKSFKIRVDKEAKEGDNNIEFEYKDCAGCLWTERSMPITVIEYQTTFDVVLQEISSDGVFIAIANIGKNQANAITVSIPEQEYFTTDLTSSSIVGNLESGDYTIAAFKILPNQISTEDRKDSLNTKKELFVQIDYTDPFGVRRSVVKQLLLNPSSLTRVSGDQTETSTQFVRKNSAQGSSFIKDIWFWVSVVLVVILFRNPIKKMYKKVRGAK